MPSSSKAKVISIKGTSATVLVLDGDWRDNVYRMPVVQDLKVFQFVEIFIHSEGTRADWQSRS